MTGLEKIFVAVSTSTNDIRRESPENRFGSNQHRMAFPTGYARYGSITNRFHLDCVVKSKGFLLSSLTKGSQTTLDETDSTEFKAQNSLSNRST